MLLEEETQLKTLRIWNVCVKVAHTSQVSEISNKFIVQPYVHACFF